MRQWVGERQPQNVVIDGFVVTNLKWENSLVIERTALEDDQYGVYSDMLIPNLARHAKLLPDQQISSTIEANGTSFDGRAFFASNHYIDPQAATGSQSNDLGTSKPLNGTNLAVAQAAMMNFKGPDNLPMGCYGDTILVPPSLAYVADTLANAAFYPEIKNIGSNGVFSAQSNVFQGKYRVAVSPWLTDSGDPNTAVWYLIDARDMNLRPFFWQEREAPQLVSLVDPANPAVFFQDNYYMGVRSRGAAAASLWFKAVRLNHS
jgi:phage major head subunit gpT-like protein